jgi:protein transport protein SEC61 subunit gamma-like protein
VAPRSTKPDQKEFMAVAKATSAGFLIMGFIGFIVKIVHIREWTMWAARMLL